MSLFGSSETTADSYSSRTRSSDGKRGLGRRAAPCCTDDSLQQRGQAGDWRRFSPSPLTTYPTPTEFFRLLQNPTPPRLYLTPTGFFDFNWFLRLLEIVWLQPDPLTPTEPLLTAAYSIADRRLLSTQLTECPKTTGDYFDQTRTTFLRPSGFTQADTRHINLSDWSLVALNNDWSMWQINTVFWFKFTAKS